MSHLNQVNIQFRTKEGFDHQQERKFQENLRTLIVGAAAEAGIAIDIDGPPLHITRHVHDAQSVTACHGCVDLAQDGRA